MGVRGGLRGKVSAWEQGGRKARAQRCLCSLTVPSCAEDELLDRMARKPSVCESEVGEVGRETIGGWDTSVRSLPWCQKEVASANLIGLPAAWCHPTSAPSQVRSYMRQILEGICYLHQHQVLHLDIKVSAPCVPADGASPVPRCASPQWEPPAKLQPALHSPVARKPPDGRFKQ